MSDPQMPDADWVLDEPLQPDSDWVLDEPAPAPIAVGQPDAITNDELALRTRGPTVNLGNGLSVLRSSFTTEAAPGGVAFTSDGTRTLASIADGNELRQAGPSEENRAAIVEAFRLSSSKEGPALQRAAEISRRFGVPTSQVMPNLERFEATARAADFDPDRWYRENRVLFEALADNGPLLAGVMADPHVGPLVQGLRKVEDLTGIPGSKLMKLSMLPALGPLAVVDEWWNAGENIAKGKPVLGEMTEADRAKRDTKQVQLDTPEAQAIKATSGIERTALTLAKRYREARASTSMGYAGFDLAAAENNPLASPQEVAERLAEVQNLRAAGQPAALGEEGLLADVGQAVQGVVSSADNLLARAAVGLAAGGPAGAVAGLGTLATTKNPALALEAAVTTGEAFASKGQQFGGLWQGFKAEGGSKYLELREAKTDAGQTLSPREALGGAVLYGAVASWLENLGTNATAGVAAGALKDRLKALLLKDATFRARASNLGKAWAEGALTEGTTEGLQSTADQLVQYVAESLKDTQFQKRDVISPEQVLTEWQAGALAGGGISAVTMGVPFAIEQARRERDAVVAPRQVGLITALASVEGVRKAPAEFAEVVKRATEEQGAPVREFWVEAAEVQRFFQEQGKDEGQAELELGESAGVAAVNAYREALATGGRMAVPLEQVLSTWAESEVGKAMLPHTTTSELGVTPAQASDPARMEEIQADAQAIADKVLATAADEQAFDEELDAMRADIIDSGRSGEEALKATRIIRAWYETQKARNPGLTFKQLLEKAGRLSFAEGEQPGSGVRVEALDAFTNLRDLIDFGEDGKPLSLERRASLVFIDDVTNLRNGEEAFDLVPTPAGMQVAVLTTADAKAINDNPDGSHDATNALMKRIAAVVAKVDPQAARAGTNFLLHVRDQQALDGLLEQVRASLPAGLTVDAGLGATRQAASVEMDRIIDEKRKSGALPPRGGTNFTTPLKGLDFAAGVELPAPQLANQHLGAVDAEGAYESREAFGNRAFLDRRVPGLLSRLGFLSSKPAKFTASMDLRAIRDSNLGYGKRAGDVMLDLFGNALVRLGGYAFSAAHLSGDEYAMRSDSKEALLEMLADVRDDLAETKVELPGDKFTVESVADVKEVASTLGTESTGVLVVNGNESPFTGAGALVLLAQGLPAGSVDGFVRIDAQSLPGLQFRFGLAEGDYGAADRDLNTRKRDELAGAQGKNDGVAPQGGTVRDDLRPRRASLEERRGRGAARGIGPSGPFVDVAAASAAGDGGADSSFGEEAGRAPGRVALAHPEDIAAARAKTARLRDPARKARFTAFLNYLDGRGPRPKSGPDESAGLKRSEQLAMLREFGLDDPEGTFAEQRQLGGIDAGLRRAKKKKTGTANPNQAEETRLKLQRGEKLFYQSGVSRALPDGRRVVFQSFDAPVAGKMVMETGVSLMDVAAMRKSLAKVREAYATPPANAPADDQQTVAFYAGLRDRMVAGLEDGIAAVEAGNADEATTRIGDAFDAEASWLPAEQLLASNMGEAVDALGRVFTLAEVRAGNPFELSEADQQDLLVAIDEYEAETGRMQQDETTPGNPRGYIEPAESESARTGRRPIEPPGVGRVMRVFLNRRADASTVMHESAHGFLEMLGNLAESEGSSAGTKREWAEALKWLGVEKRSDITREHHEKWARAFEAYLREGKAPSKNLWAVFARFKMWLVRIYKSVTDLRVELDPNITRIFDRMLATDREIAAANGRRGQSPWASAKEAGLSQEDWEDYLAEQQEAQTFATREAAAAHLKVALREAERDFDEAVQAAMPAALAEYEAQPGRRAQAYLEGQAKDLLEAGLSMEPVVLARADVEAAVGLSAARRFRTRANGTPADEVAPLVQFATGREMLQAVAALPKRDAWVKARAEAMVRERDAATVEEFERLREGVRDGLQTYTEDRIAREWEELGRRAQPGDDVSQLGRQVALAKLKLAARLIVDGQGVGRLSPAKVLQLERQAARKVQQAALKGDWDSARDWFRQQTLQVYVHRYTLEAVKFRDGAERLAEQLAGTPARARAGKASPALRDGIDFLLGAVGLSTATELDAGALQAAADSLEESGTVPGPWLQALTDAEALRPILQEGNYTNLTVAELRQVDDALRQFQAEVRDRTETILGEQKADLEATEAAMVAEAEQVLPKRAPPGTATSDSGLDVVLSKASALDGFLLNPADLVRDITGDNIDSTWWRALIEPLRAAKAREVEFLKRAVQPITDALEAMPDEVKARLRETVDGRALFPGHVDALVPRQRHELLMMALNVGNEGNLQRLTDGRGITAEQLAKALDTLTDGELAWVEKVWAAVGALKEDAFNLEERDTGLRPRGVEAMPFRLPSGRVLRGGYFPAVYDRRASLLGEKQQAELVAGLLDPRFVRPGTAHGHLKSRAALIEDQAITLDLHVIYRHLAAVAHDLAFREAVKSVGRLVLRPKVQQAMRERLGDAKARTFLQFLKDVGGSSGVEVTEADKMMASARGAAAHVLLGWKASTALGDFANLAAAVASTPLRTKHLAAGLRDFGKAPVASREAALKASPWLRTMADNTRQQFDQQLRTILDKQLPKALQVYKDHAFALMEAVNVATATPVWLGAHRQALAEGREEAEAVRFADDIVSRVFPSHSPVDQAAILRDRGFWGRFTMFYGYLSVAYRAQHRLVAPLFSQEFRTAGLGQQAKTVGGVAARLFGFYTAYSVLGELLMGRGPEAGDDDEDDPSDAKRWRNWFVRKLVAGPLSTQPFLPLTAAMEAMATGKVAPSPRGSPLASLADLIGRDLWKAFDGDQPALTRVLAALKLALEARGIPVAPLDVQGRYLFDVALGNITPEGPGDVASGLVYGQRKNQPANIFRPAGGQ